MLLLKRRTWGEKCEEEWDDITQRYSGNKCDTCNCYGTGIREGFFAPIKFKGMINARPKRDEITMFGEFKPSDVVLYTTNFPPLRPSDVVVEDEKKYIVLQVQPVERLGIAIEQRVQMSLLHPDDEVNTQFDQILESLEAFLVDDDGNRITDENGNYIII